jgi:hypothetical protein
MEIIQRPILKKGHFLIVIRHTIPRRIKIKQAKAKD